ncbi:MAG: mercuric reductase [Caldilineaceae bacterium]|nr:mercuric reductase [Caldilineaceae bacterium]
MQQSATRTTPKRDTPKQYDAIVIGSGQSGGPLATTMAEAGRNVALVERAHVGGTCVNVGCTPTKTMVASARVAYVARRSAEYGVHIGPVRVEMAEVRQRKREMVERFRSSSLRSIEKTEGVELVKGEAHFIDQDGTPGRFQIEVAQDDGTTQVLTAGQIFINTGTRPHLPELPGLSSVPYLDHATIMELDRVPDHLLILGGGYIGLEFGQMFRRFGSDVTIVQRGKQLLPREDSDVAEAVTAILREDGIEVLLEAQARNVVQKAEDSIHLQVELPGEVRSFVGSHLLVATGRQPNSNRLHLEKVGVDTDKKGYIQVNERLETNVPSIYALGDVKGGPAFTHISYDDFRILRTNLLGKGGASTKDRLVPYTVYMDPELGRVGLGEEEARQQGYKIQVAKLPMKQVARAQEIDETRGFMKAVVDAESQQILGCAILGVHGGEIAAVLQVAMMGHLPYPAIQNGVFAHPTLAESLNNLFTTLHE